MRAGAEGMGCVSRGDREDTKRARVGEWERKGFRQSVWGVLLRIQRQAEGEREGEGERGEGEGRGGTQR